MTLKTKKLAFTFSISAMLALTSMGNITNMVPYTNTFEQYTNGTYLMDPPTNGWYCESGVSNNVITITTNWANWTNGYSTNLIPIPAAAHQKVAILSDTVTNAITQPSANKDVYIDMMIKPTIWASTEHPAIDTKSKFAMYFNTNFHPVLYVTTPTETATYTGPTNWIVLTNATISTTEWIRVTVLVDWGTTGLPPIAHDWFLLKLNGVTYDDDNGFAQVRNPTRPGPWFVCANNSPDILSGISFMGNTLLDDFQVMTNNPLNITMYSLTLSVLPEYSAKIEPGGIVKSSVKTYESGSSNGLSFTFNSLTNYLITNTCVNGTTYLGPSATNYSFPPITTNYTLTVLTKGVDIGVVVSNASVSRPGLAPAGYGTPAPFGLTNYEYNTSATLTISGSPQALNSQTQIVCKGWTATGSILNEGTTTNTTFFVTAYSTLTWLWDYQYFLTTINYGHGYISPSNSWHTHGDSIELRAYGYPPDGIFTAWSGDTNDCTIVGDILTIPPSAWTGPRTINAHFSGGTTARGTDYDYILQYYPTNYQMEVAEEWDTDGDGFKTWEEYITGTDPTNSASKFQIINIGSSNGSNFVTFYGTTNSGVTIPFGMRLITNMLLSSSWTNWESIGDAAVERSSDGTNTFWYTPSPDTNAAFYIPIAVNPTP